MTKEILRRFGLLERKRLKSDQIFQNVRLALGEIAPDISVARFSPALAAVDKKVCYAAEIRAPDLVELEQQVGQLLVQVHEMVSTCNDILLEARMTSFAHENFELREMEPRGGPGLLISLLDDSPWDEMSKKSANSAYQELHGIDVAPVSQTQGSVRIKPTVLALEGVQILFHENERLLRKRISVIVENGLLKFGDLEVSNVESLGDSALYQFSLELASKRIADDLVIFFESAFRLVDIATVASKYELGFEQDGLRYGFGILDLQ